MFLGTIKWVEQYSLSSQIVHASPQATFGTLGIYGIRIAADQSAIILTSITKMILSLFLNFDNMLAIISIEKWLKVVREYFRKTEEELLHKTESVEEGVR